MSIKFYKTAVLLTALLISSIILGQQTTSIQNPQNHFLANQTVKKSSNIKNFFDNEPKITIHNGSVYADFAGQKIDAKEIVKQLNELLGLDANYTFEQISQRNDEIGFTHTNFQQFYNGYPVDGHIIMFHEKDGLLKSINGNFATLKKLDVKINISDIQAIGIAKEHLNVTVLAEEYPVETVFAKNPTDGQYFPAKKVRIESFSPLLRYNVFVDVTTGEVFNKISLLYNADVNASGTTLYSGQRQFICDSYSGSYRLRDNARKIHTKDGVNWNIYNPTVAPYFTNTSTIWAQHMSLDVHWGMEITYDYYLNTFQRNSFDGLGSNIYNIVNPALLDEDGMQTNAAALGSGYMLYGRGDNVSYGAVVGLDVEGHEFTHMVTETNGNGGLDYQGESGALNESFSDIFATCIEFYSNVNPNWTIGENVKLVYPYYMRSMSNPKICYQPGTYHGEYWVNTSSSSDAGGVHTNSGVQNFWFYLLCQGGSGVNDLGNPYSVTGIGIDLAQKIVYRNLMTYLIPTSGFVSSYQGSLQAAADLFGNPSAQYTAVEQAWYAVGIDNTTTPPLCELPVYLKDASGTFEDGSGDEMYENDLQCWWYIKPACATYVTLTFSAFDLENNYDYVIIYDGMHNVLKTITGSTIPASTTSYTGDMLVKMTTDGSIQRQGFTASYTSDADEYGVCSGVTTLTDESGTITDGSGDSDYCNNMDCQWVIQPPGATSVTLSFSEFDVEDMGVVVYDFVAVYKGPLQNNVLLGLYYGNNLPPTVTAYSESMTVVFHSDEGLTSAGFTAHYTSSTSALKDVENNDKITVFPNPTKGIVNVQFSANQQNIKFELYDMVGKLIRQFSEQNITENGVKQLNIDGIPNGIYDLRVISDTSRTNHKLIISR
ncbi:MAG: M4 family metallopeptidase [Prevotellaceae bacterium]|jgi:Zn-dependent metalloprotease|nr:M4 family metallopeptidase [Prevotellaceae bacterium]